MSEVSVTGRDLLNSVISIIGVSTCLGDVLYRDLLTKAAIATASFRPSVR